MIESYLKKVVAGEDLNELEAETAMTAIMAGQVRDVLIAAYLTALRAKGESVAEIVGSARAMRRAATHVQTRHPLVVDTCGTGGDGRGTFNISTTAAFVVAAAGVPVAKHGNRSVSSRAGSADVLEALGANLNLDAAKVGACLDAVGFGFLFAPLLHSAMKHAAPVRRALGFRTIFNILGPLTNPAGAASQVVGVYEARLAPVLAEVLNGLGTRRSLVVHSEDGLDEISISAPTLVYEADGADVRGYRIRPEDFGLRRAPLAAVTGGDAADNAAIARDVLAGKPGPARDIVLLNAGAALYAGGRAETIAEGVRLAADAIDSGAARRTLERFIAFTHRVAEEAAG
ncbi:MAG: anthranilate phosphoribosyltransferase [Clostridia bacterium]|nr:anthranilate phosphoribosyltransferase [Clostridia bacterium]